MTVPLRLLLLIGIFLTTTLSHVLIVTKAAPPRTNAQQAPSDGHNALVLSPCTRGNLDGKWLGRGIKFVLPRGVKAKKIPDIDYQKYLVQVSNNAKPPELWWGPLVSAPSTTQQLRDASINSEKKTIQDSAKNERGFDSRGETSGGKYWRVFDVPGVALPKYEGMSDELHRSYDTIINSACFDNP